MRFWTNVAPPARSVIFYFRLDAPVQTDDKVATGKVSQCLTSSLETLFWRR